MKRFIRGCPNSWMVFVSENPMKMKDDWGLALFFESANCRYSLFTISFEGCKIEISIFSIECRNHLRIVVPKFDSVYVFLFYHETASNRAASSWIFVIEVGQRNQNRWCGCVWETWILSGNNLNYAHASHMFFDTAGEECIPCFDIKVWELDIRQPKNMQNSRIQF